MCRTARDPNRGTPAAHAAAWDPTSVGRAWTSKYNIIDAHSSRIAYSSQRQRDGSFQPDRKERLLSKGQQPGTLGPHPQVLRDGSPRHHVHKEHVLQWGHAADYQTTHRNYYANPAGLQAPGGPGGSGSGSSAMATSSRHMGAMPRRITPGIYATVFGRVPGEPPGSPRGMPAHSRVATRGAAHVPTAGHWAEPPPSTRPMLASPRVQESEDAYALMLLESQIRSEKRMADAALAMGMAVKAQREATQKRWEDAAAAKLSHAGGSLSARF
jgi:hypothetical protein